MIRKIRLKNFLPTNSFLDRGKAASNVTKTEITVNTNEYRTILFAVDNDNIILSKKVLLLYGFLKKSTKDYCKQIKIAERILKDFEL